MTLKTELVVQMDASSVGSGAVLSEAVIREEHSMVLKAESCRKKCSKMEQECITIKWAMESQIICLGKDIPTDLNSLLPKWMCQVKEKNSTVLGIHIKKLLL